MNIGSLIEIGVAVTDLLVASQTFASLLNTRTTDIISAPMFSMDFRMCRLWDVDFELMMPCAESSVVSRFMSRRGEGLHHIAFQVPDIHETISRCHARGLPIIADEPVSLGDLRAAFLHPRCICGLLVEFVENLHNWGGPPADDEFEQEIARITGFGVAVRNVDAAASEYEAVLGAEISERRWSERLGTHVRHADVSGIRFELFPAPAAQTAKLDRDGQGLHHVCLGVRQPDAFAAIRKSSATRGEAETGGVFLTEPTACHGVMFEIHAEKTVTASLGA